MVYQVLIHFNEKKSRPLDVADSEEEFGKTTIRELKEKYRESNPGAPDPEDFRVIFGADQLEDDLTLGFYQIKHLSVLWFVLKIPGGGGGDPEPPDKGFPRSDSMEQLQYSM